MSTSDPKKSYHHGDLRNALISEAVSVARAEGPSAVVLRDIARRVGVSHNAGYRHFDSREALLSAVAQVGLAELAAEMRRGMGLVSDPDDTEPGGADGPARARSHLRAIGRAYVDYARSEPGMFRTIWAAAAYPAATHVELTADQSIEARLSTGSDPYALLNAVLDEMVATGAMPASRRPYSEITAWSAVHGLSTLLIDGPLAVMPTDAVEGALDRLCQIIDAGL